MDCRDGIFLLLLAAGELYIDEEIGSVSVAFSDAVAQLKELLSSEDFTGEGEIGLDGLTGALEDEPNKPTIFDIVFLATDDGLAGTTPGTEVGGFANFCCFALADKTLSTG